MPASEAQMRCQSEYAKEKTFDYQSVMPLLQNRILIIFEQSTSLTTSQFATAPKHICCFIGLIVEFDYQSECHCSKTLQRQRTKSALFDYQSECHCSKTGIRSLPDLREV